MKKTLCILLTILAVLFGVLLILLIILFSWSAPKQYVTSDIADYGQYTGNYDNKSAQAFISSFFPEQIEDTFSDITYSYRAQKNDAYAFEAYLAFKIEDSDAYTAFVEKYTAGKECSEFRYDNTYDAYTLIDEFLPVTSDSQQTENMDDDIHIQYAKIGKILCAPNRQEVIFIALGVYDGGIVTTDFLTVYFDQFEIDPLEYAKHAVPVYY